MQQLTWIQAKGGGGSTAPLRQLTENSSLFKGEKKSGEDAKDRKTGGGGIPVISMDKLGIKITGDKQTSIDPWPLRKRIYQQMMTQRQKYGPQELLHPQVLLDILDGYDALFFNNQLRASLKKMQGRDFAIEWSDKEMKKGWAGFCRTEEKQVTIRIHPDVAKIKIDQKKGECCNGIVCLDALSSLQIILEHELVHVLVNACLQLKCSHGAKFKQLAEHIFGHLATTHEFGLGDGYKRAQQMQEQKALLEKMKPGVSVSHKQSHLQGIVLRSAAINMTLLLSDGTLLHKVPIAEAAVVAAPNKELAKLWHLFSRTKDQMKKGTTVSWTEKGNIIHGSVLRIKPLMADIQLPNSSLQASVPYHLLSIVTTNPAK